MTVPQQLPEAMTVPHPEGVLPDFVKAAIPEDASGWLLCQPLTQSPQTSLPELAHFIHQSKRTVTVLSSQVCLLSSDIEIRSSSSSDLLLLFAEALLVWKGSSSTDPLARATTRLALQFVGTHEQAIQEAMLEFLLRTVSDDVKSPEQYKRNNRPDTTTSKTGNVWQFRGQVTQVNDFWKALLNSTKTRTLELLPGCQLSASVRESLGRGVHRLDLSSYPNSVDPFLVQGLQSRTSPLEYLVVSRCSFDSSNDFIGFLQLVSRTPTAIKYNRMMIQTLVLQDFTFTVTESLLLISLQIQSLHLRNCHVPRPFFLHLSSAYWSSLEMIESFQSDFPSYLQVLRYLGSSECHWKRLSLADSTIFAPFGINSLSQALQTNTSLQSLALECTHTLRKDCLLFQSLVHHPKLTSFQYRFKSAPRMYRMGMHTPARTHLLVETLLSKNRNIIECPYDAKSFDKSVWNAHVEPWLQYNRLVQGRLTQLQQSEWRDQILPWVLAQSQHLNSAWLVVRENQDVFTKWWPQSNTTMEQDEEPTRTRMAVSVL